MMSNQKGESLLNMLLVVYSSLPDDLGDCVELYTVSVDNLNLRFLELDQEIPGILTY